MSGFKTEVCGFDTVVFVICVFNNYKYLGAVRTKLNIIIEESLLEKAKAYASKKQASLSRIIEEYFETITQRTSSENHTLLDMVDKLKPDAAIIKKRLVKDAVYKAQKEKYGY